MPDLPVDLHPRQLLRDLRRALAELRPGWTVRPTTAKITGLITARPVRRALRDLDARPRPGQADGCRKGAQVLRFARPAQAGVSSGPHMAAPRQQLRRRGAIAPMVRPASPHRERGLELLQEGRTAGEVHEELGVPLPTVKGWARSLKLRGPGERGPDQKPRAKGPRPLGPRRPRGPDRQPRGPHEEPRSRALWAIDLLLQGVPVAQIAAALGVSRQAIYRVRKRWISDGPA